MEYENGGTVGNKTVEGIRFNPVTGAFEGTDEESFITEAPGEPRQRRSALAVVLEQAIALLREKVQAEKMNGRSR